MDQLEHLEACRICVTCFPIQEMDFIYIFQKNQEFQQELDFIQAEIQHWQLKIHPDDGLPQRICANCFAKFCSIEAYRRECEQAQEKLIETVRQQTTNEESVGELLQEGLLKQNDTQLPLVGNYESGSVAIKGDPSVLVSSVTLAQADVSLNDFRVFDQQFSHFDNPALMDDSSTLLDNNLIAPETANDLDFLPSQNIFTFETAEPPSTATLPLVDTDSTSIMNDLMEVGAGDADEPIIKQDLEDMLQHSIIPTTTKLNLKTHPNKQTDSLETLHIKSEMGNQYNNANFNTRVKNDFQNISSVSISPQNRDDNCSDHECDESEINARLKDLSYTCHYCFCPDTGPINHLVFPNEDALSQHFFDIHDPNRPYTCPQCVQSYKTQLLRDNHIRLLHNVTESQICNFCQKRLSGSMEVHQYNCQYVGDWECQQCKEKFLKTPIYRFRLHQRQHERTKSFKCRICDRTFLRKANLEAHQRMHKTEESSTISCNVCNGKFTDDYNLKRHKYEHHGGEPPVKCELCHKGFSSVAFLQRHMNQFNAGRTTKTTSSSPSSEHQHTCLNCNAVFKTIQTLQNHLILGRDKNGNCLYASCNKQERRKLQLQGVFPCFHCPRRFHLRSQLDKHLNTHDARLRPFQCQQCYVRCRTAIELKQHVNVAHLNIKAFACDKCGKCFGYKKDLRDHMLFHAEINVHCTEDGCKYVCKNDKALNDHIRHKHRLLSCEYCHEQFTRQKLTAHLRNVHRTEIDVELASESDNYYKSQLLNNNNDITQISFNLLNTQTPQNTPSPTPCNKSTLTSSAINNIQQSTKSSSILNSPTSSLSSLSSCLTNAKCSDTLTASSTQNTIDDHNDGDDDPHQQLCSIFNDVANASHSTLALNGLISTEHDLNLVTNDTTSMFLVPSSSSSANDNQLDQYFMASLMDTEQEIIVT